MKLTEAEIKRKAELSKKMSDLIAEYGGFANIPYKDAKYNELKIELGKIVAKENT